MVFVIIITYEILQIKFLCTKVRFAYILVGVEMLLFPLLTFVGKSIGDSHVVIHIVISMFCYLYLVFFCQKLKYGYKRSVNMWYIVMPLVSVILSLPVFTFTMSGFLWPLPILGYAAILSSPGYIYVHYLIYNNEKYRLNMLTKRWILISLLVSLIVSFVSFPYSLLLPIVSPWILCSFFCSLNMMQIFIKQISRNGLWKP